MFVGLFLFQVERPLKTQQTLLVLRAVVGTLILFMRFSAEIAVSAATLAGCLVGTVTS